MRIRRPKNLTGAELGLATLLGVLGGVYIWKPYITDYKDKIKNAEENKKE